MKPNYKSLSKFLTTIQFPDKRYEFEHPKIVDEYCQRIETTRKKIGKVWIPTQLQAYNPGDVEIIQALYDAIGVYRISNVLEGKSFDIWHKMKSDGTYHYPGGNDWYDYLGDNKITTIGGFVVVVLSDYGVKWLNEIADTVKKYIPSDVPTTKPTNEKNDHENEQDEFFEDVIARLNADFDEMIGLKIIYEIPR
jgi:hypothetical protein